MFYPVRPGNRGGRDLFKWDDVRYMKYNDREQYLGVTVRAGYLDKGGKWRKGDWYTKEKGTNFNQQLNSEKLSVQEQDEKRIRQALGLEEKEIIDEGPKLTKYEIEEITRKEEMEVNEDNPTGALGLGFKLNEKAILSQKLANDPTINYNRLEGEGISAANPTEEEKKSKSFQSDNQQTNPKLNATLLQEDEKEKRAKKKAKKEKKKEKQKQMGPEDRGKYLQELQDQIRLLKERKELKQQQKIKESSKRKKSRSHSKEKQRHHHHKRR